MKLKRDPSQCLSLIMYETQHAHLSYQLNVSSLEIYAKNADIHRNRESTCVPLGTIKMLPKNHALPKHTWHPFSQRKYSER